MRLARKTFEGSMAIVTRAISTGGVQYSPDKTSYRVQAMVSGLIVYIIRKYASTFYIGIAMVILPYFGPMGKLKFQFHFQFPLYLTSTNTKVENMLKANDI